MVNYKCKNCKNTTLVKDEFHAEVYCPRCGLVHEHPPIHSLGKPAKQYCFH